MNATKIAAHAVATTTMQTSVVDGKLVVAATFASLLLNFSIALDFLILIWTPLFVRP